MNTKPRKPKNTQAHTYTHAYAHTLQKLFNFVLHLASSLDTPTIHTVEVSLEAAVAFVAASD